MEVSLGEYSPGKAIMATEKVVSIRASDAEPWCDESPEFVLAEMRGTAKPSLLGLPCARCHAYYDADLDACPICGCGERVPPQEASAVTRPKAA